MELFKLKFDERGREIPDPRPMELPAGAKRPESLRDMVQRMVSTQMSQMAVEQGGESFEEANDFEIPGEDDFADSMTPHEVMAEEVIPAEFEVRAERRAREEEQKEGDTEVAAPPSKSPQKANKSVLKTGSKAAKAAAQSRDSDPEDGGKDGDSE